MSKGYIAIAQNSRDDYLRMAYALALSIKATQLEVKDFCLCTDETTAKLITDDHKKVFDHIVMVPEVDTRWKIDNKWMYYDLSPFDETMVLDVDMLFVEPIDFWWDTLQEKDMWLPNHTLTFRGEVVNANNYRIKFVDKKLPNVYTNMMYFKKGDYAFHFFRMLKHIFQDWNRYYESFLVGPGQDSLSADLAYAFLIKVLGIEGEVTDPRPTPTFVHMKSKVQNVRGVEDNWEESLGCTLGDDLSLYVGNYRQTMPFHYVNKMWLTDEKLSILEKTLND